MANIKISKKLFEKEIGKLDEKMQEKIALFGTPLEGFDDNEIELEIFPNRPDLLSYQGFKRGFLGWLGKKKGLHEIKVSKPEKNFDVVVDDSVSKIRPYTVCAIVKGLKFDDEKIKEIIDIQEKLHTTVGRKRKKIAIGVYPLETIRLPIKFEARKPEDIKFQPLEFPREINGRQILSQHPAGRDYGHLMEGLDKYSVFVDANSEILSMPPIINSHKTGKIGDKTTDVFIEISGSDLEIQKRALNILVSALGDMGGKIYQMRVKYGSKTLVTPDFTPEKMKINLGSVNKLLGLDLKEGDVKGLLERMGYDHSKGVVSVPAYRIDVLHEVDLIEDIAIAYGYNNLEPEIPEVSTIGEIDQNVVLKSNIAEILVGLNMLETSSYHLTTKEHQIKKMGLKKSDFIEVLDSKTKYTILRKDLTHYLLKILGENVDVEYPQEIFQIGTVFDGLDEKENLAIALAPGNFTKLKQVFEYLGKMLGVKFEIVEPDEIPGHFIEGRVGEVLFEGKKIGYFGEVHPRLLRNFKIKMPVALGEICLDGVLKELS